MNFDNTRHIKPACSDPFVTEEEALRSNFWTEAEVTDNINVGGLGDLGLTTEEEDAIVAFMEALSDGYVEAARQWAGVHAGRPAGAVTLPA